MPYAPSTMRPTKPLQSAFPPSRLSDEALRLDIQAAAGAILQYRKHHPGHVVDFAEQVNELLRRIGRG